MRIVNVVGARPNFVKISPLLRAMRADPDIEPCLVHTGQHYDTAMAGSFFEELEIPAPDVSLEVGSGSHAVQTAEVMRRLEPALERIRPDLVLVVGDVNSTLAAALTAVKLQMPVAHVEAGLRSFDRSMPEEINRIVVDAVSDHLFVTEESAVTNLIREGREPGSIHFVGNVMIDALEGCRTRWARLHVCDRLGLEPSRYGVVTLHRPSNVDDRSTFGLLLDALEEIARHLPLVFPVHPRTRARLASADGDRPRAEGEPTSSKGIRYVDPLGYLEFIALMADARVVLTDSGGIQEETTALGVPCLTLRDSTERPVTTTHGTNRVVGTSPERIVEEAIRAIDGPRPAAGRPPLWDGKASERVVAVLRDRVGGC